MKNNIIVDDLFSISIITEMMSLLSEFSQYETQEYKDDISMFNQIYITSLWRRIENGKDVCLEAKRVK